MLIKFFNRLIDNISNMLPLRFVLVSLFILQIIAVVGLVGWLSFQNGQKAVNDVAKQLRGEIMARVEQHLSPYLTPPHLINSLNLKAIQQGQLDFQNSKDLEKHFFEQIQVFDSASYIYFATQESGKETGAQRKPDGSITVWDGCPVQKRFVEYTTNKQGNRVKETGDFHNNYDARERVWYKAAVQTGKPAWTPIYLWLTTGTSIDDVKKLEGVMVGIDANVPIYNDAGKLQGVLGVAMILTDINEFLSTLKIGKHGQTFIIERSGEIVATSTFEMPLISHSVDGLEHERRKATESNFPLTRATAQHLEKQFGDLKNIQTSAQLDFNLNGLRQFIQVAPFQDQFGLDWLVVVTVPEDDFMAQINANTRNTIILSIIALIITILIALLTANWIIRPILQINAAAKKLAQRQWEQALPVKRSDELGQLARSFNLMAKQLKASMTTLEFKNEELQKISIANAKLYTELQESEQTLKQFLEAMPIGISVLDANGKPYFANHKSQELFGKEAEQAATVEQFSKIYQFYQVNTSQLYPVENLPAIRALRGESIHVDDIEIRQSGNTIPLENWGTPIFDEHGNTTYALSVFQDISERLKQEQAERAHDAAKAVNKAIMASIQYAKLIQSSLLPNLEQVKTYLPNYFFLGMPRDIVGGDMLYFEPLAEGFIVAVIDCTGHGVPGAFMTMIAITSLKRIVKDEGIHEPSQVLQRLNFLVKTSLQQDTKHAQSDDGLDTALCLVKPQKNRLTFAGAKLPLYCVHDTQVKVIKGDKHSLGYKKSQVDFSFTTHTVAIEAGMSFYLATDGFIDQLGGSKRFSFGKKRFKNLLLENHQQSFEEQSQTLLEAFNEYKGGNDRQDDVTVVGFGF